MVNNWIGYIQRGYQEIKDTLLNRLSINVPEITDRSESNIFVILLSMWAGLVEQMNYYIDMSARENYISTARLQSSLIKIAKLYNYRVRFSSPARSEVIITLLDSTTGDPIDATSDILIPQGTNINTLSGITYTTDYDYTILAGTKLVWAECTQQTFSTNITLGTTSGVVDETILVPNDIVDESISITINGNTYSFVDNFAYSTATDKHFTTTVDEDLNTFLLFGDGVNGIVVEIGNIIADYAVTLGDKGLVDRNTLTNIATITTPVNTVLSVTNPNLSQGGVPVENIEILKKKLPLSIRTLNRAVTLNDAYNDFADIAILSPGIYEADAVKSDCGFLIDIYLVPYNGGIASQSQLNITQAYVDSRKVIGAQIETHPAGESELVLYANVTGKPNYKDTRIEGDIDSVLEDNYNWKTKKLDQDVHISDIIALIDNLPVIDFLTITNFYAIPYPNPIDGTDLQMIWDFEVVNGDPSVVWMLEIVSSSTNMYKLYKDGVYQSPDIQSGVLFSNGYFNMTIQIPDLTAGHAIYRWEFITQESNKDINLTDHSLPVFYTSNIYLNITEQ